MILDLSPEDEALLVELAEREGRSVAAILTEAAIRLVQQDISLRISLEQADRGEFIEEEEMDARFARMLQPK